MSISLFLAIVIALVALGLGWFLGGRRTPPDPYQSPLNRLVQGLRDGRLPAGEPTEPATLQEVRAAIQEGWAPRNAERQEALKQALGRIAAFLEESVEGPLKKVRSGDEALLREGVDRALGGLKDLEFFLREPITPDETHNLVPVMQQVTREFIADWEVAVRFQAPAFPVRAHIHKANFMDAVYLLLSNAGQFGEGKRVDVMVEEVDKHAVVTIRDQGPGFTEEALERARDLFYSTKPTGLGLGIPFARKIIEGFGGNLELSNRAEGGAEVRLVLPGA